MTSTTPGFARRGMTRPMISVLGVGVLLAGIAAVAMGSTTPARGAPSVAWISWSTPTNWNTPVNLASANVPNQTATYRYATGTTGQLTVNGSTVYVELSGEIVDATGTFFGSWSNNCSTGRCFGNPSGFGTGAGEYWGNLYYANSNTFVSANVPTNPPNGDRIGLIGNPTGGVQQQRLRFFSDAGLTTPATVSNIVMNINSLGSGPSVGAWAFTNDFSVLVDNNNVNQSGVLNGSGTKSNGLTRSLSGNEFVVSGNEGAGTIQFTGTFNEFTWRVEHPEAWASWNIGSTTENPPLSVTYDTQGGTLDSAGTTLTSMGATLATLPTASYAGHTFNGWFTAPSGGTRITTTSTHNQTGNFILYAQWTPLNQIVATSTTTTTTVPATTTVAPSTTTTTETPTAAVTQTAADDEDALPVTGSSSGVLFLAYIMVIAGASVMLGVRVYR